MKETKTKESDLSKSKTRKPRTTKTVKRKELNEDQLTPYEYFNYVKSKISEMDRPQLTLLYDNAYKLFTKYQVTGQKASERKVAFHLKTLLKELKLMDLNINKFVYKEDIEMFIEKISKKPVKIIELSNYVRELPDELVDVVVKTKDIFDEFYVLFTDYSEGELLKEVEKERDPILFGAFQTKNCSAMCERFYYLGDWEDEYCDLTLDKFVNQVSDYDNKINLVHEISLPKNSDRLIEQLSQYENTSNPDVFKLTNKELSKSKKSWFSNITKVIKRKSK